MSAGTVIAIVLTGGVVTLLLALLVVRSIEVRTDIEGIEEPVAISGIEAPVILVTPTPVAPFGGYVVVSASDDLRQEQLAEDLYFTGPLYTYGPYGLTASVPTPLPTPAEDPNNPWSLTNPTPEPTPAYLFILVEPTPGRPDVVYILVTPTPGPPDDPEPVEIDRNCGYPPVSGADRLTYGDKTYLVLRSIDVADGADLAQESMRLEWQDAELEPPPPCPTP